MIKILEKLKRRVVSSNLFVTENYDYAEKLCEIKNKSCYQSEILCKYRFEKMSNLLEVNEDFFIPPSLNILLRCIKLFVNSNKSKIPSFVDFGGACGENILFLESIFGNEIYDKSWVIETPAQVEESRKWSFSRKIRFSSSLKSVLKNKKIDIFFTSCAINYLKNPYDPIMQVVSEKVPYVILTRNNFSKNPFTFAQKSFLSENGNGKHLKKYIDREIWYPSSTISETKIKNIFDENDYSIKLEKFIDNTGVIKEKKCYSKDLIFMLN